MSDRDFLIPEVSSEFGHFWGCNPYKLKNKKIKRPLTDEMASALIYFHYEL
jgi:hypothetical protein